MELTLMLHWNQSEICSKVELVYSKGDNYFTCWTCRPIDEVEATFGVDLHKCNIIVKSFQVGDGKFIRLPYAVNPISTASGAFTREYFL